MRRLFCTTLAAAALFAPDFGEAARVKGTVRRTKAEPITESLGYTVTQVAAPAKLLDDEDAEVVIFLRAKDSKVLPKATEHLTMTIRGLEIVPDVSGCEVDAKVILLNEEPKPITVVIGDEELGVLKPNEERAYTCTAIKGDADSEMRPVRVKEWPHIRGSIHVGGPGVVAAPDDRGTFAMNAVEGKYVLRVIGRIGVMAEREVEVKKSDVDVGTIDLRPEDQRDDPPPPAPPPPKPAAPRPPPPPVEDEVEEGDEGVAP